VRVLEPELVRVRALGLVQGQGQALGQGLAQVLVLVSERNLKPSSEWQAVLLKTAKFSLSPISLLLNQVSRPKITSGLGPDSLGL
jgi:hypothetical protein